MSLPPLSLTNRFGFRGSALIILGGTWVIFGVAVLASPSPARPLVLHEHLPPWARLAGWALTGLVAVAYGLRGRGPVDTPGMIALMLMPLERALSFAGSWVAYVLSTAWQQLDPSVSVMGWSGGWYSSAVWLLVIVIVRLIAGWPNPRPLLDTGPTS